MFVLSWGSPGWGVKAWHCPGFGQDRVNFHRTPARGTAGGMGADPTRPNRARCSIPCDVTRGSDGGGGAAVTVTRGADGGSGAAVTRSWLGSAGPGPESRSVMRVCVLFSPYLYRCCCCSLCLLFCQTALIPTHLFLPILFHSPPHPGGGRGGRVALLLPAAAEPEHHVPSLK